MLLEHATLYSPVGSMTLVWLSTLSPRHTHTQIFNQAFLVNALLRIARVGDSFLSPLTHRKASPSPYSPGTPETEFCMATPLFCVAAFTRRVEKVYERQRVLTSYYLSAWSNNADQSGPNEPESELSRRWHSEDFPRWSAFRFLHLFHSNFEMSRISS